MPAVGRASVTRTYPDWCGLIVVGLATAVTSPGFMAAEPAATLSPQGQPGIAASAGLLAAMLTSVICNGRSPPFVEGKRYAAF